MSRTSCITHPPQDAYVRRRVSYVGICGGDTCAAELLDLFQYWTDCKLERLREVRAFNEVATKLQQPTISEPTLWLYERIQDFKEALVCGFAETSIKKALKFLKVQGFIKDKVSPTKFDNTKLYLFCVDRVQQALDNWHKEQIAKTTEKSDETKTSDDQSKTSQDETDLSLDESKTSQDETDLSDISNTLSNNLSNTPTHNQSPPTPQGEEHEPACEDVASLGGSTSTQEEEREINPVREEEQSPQHTRVSETSGSESKGRVSARDNKVINPADPFYAGVIKTITKQAEKNIRASAPRRNFYRDNCWGELAIAYNFDPKKAYELLEKWIAAKAKRKDDPIGYAQAILRKWSEVEGSEDASTYWQEFKGIVHRKGFAGVEEALQPPPDRIEPTAAMSPEQEAWVGIMSQIEYVSGFVQVDIKENPSFGGWHVRTNISIPGWNVQGALSEVVRKFPLSKVRERFPEFYPECYRLAKQKFPHLILLEPISQSSNVG